MSYKLSNHNHTIFSGDNIRKKRFDETPEAYAAYATEKGFDEICITDHLVVGRSLTIAAYSNSMNPERMDEYFAEITRVAEKYPQVKITTGIELDWVPDKIDEAKEFLQQYPFDVVLGAVHVLDEIPVEYEEKRHNFWSKLNQDEIYDRHAAYYNAVQEMAKSGICDVVAHLDLIKRDNYIPKKSVQPLIEETVDAIAKKGLCVEVNTAGMKKPRGQMHPTSNVLRQCYEKGIPVTIGTDAHERKFFEYYLPEGMEVIKNAGYKEIATFKGRKIIPVKI